jgi:hypothetical protein
LYSEITTVRLCTYFKQREELLHELSDCYSVVNDCFMQLFDLTEHIFTCYLSSYQKKVLCRCLPFCPFVCNLASATKRVFGFSQVPVQDVCTKRCRGGVSFVKMGSLAPRLHLRTE